MTVTDQINCFDKIQIWRHAVIKKPWQFQKEALHEKSSWACGRHRAIIILKTIRIRNFHQTRNETFFSNSSVVIWSWKNILFKLICKNESSTGKFIQESATVDQNSETLIKKSDLEDPEISTKENVKFCVFWWYSRKSDLNFQNFVHQKWALSWNHSLHHHLIKVNFFHC